MSSSTVVAMLPGPIFRVELVSVARRQRYFWLRVVYATLILFVLWVTYTSSRFMFDDSGPASIRYSATLAANFFVSFSWLQILSILVVGPALAAGTIAAERERRTIEYLFATDLSNAEIVLGKTLARLALMGQFVLIGLPVLFLFRLMGGIPAESLLATFISATGTSLLLVGVSIAVSVWSPKARDAVGRAYLVLVALFSLPLFLFVFKRSDIIPDRLWIDLFQPIANGLFLLNPLMTLTTAVGTSSAVGIGIDMALILKCAGSQCLVAIGCLLLATFAVRRVHLAETTRSAEKRGRSKPERRPVGEHVILWKEVYSQSSGSKMGRIGWVAAALLLVGILGLSVWLFLESLFSGQDWAVRNYCEYLIGLTGYLGCSMLLYLAARSAGLISQEKERDTWVTLLSTPLAGNEIVFGKLCGNLYSARWMLAILLFSWLLGLVLAPSIIVPTLFTAVQFSLLVLYASCLGLMFSLRSPTTLRAMGQTVGTLVFFGGGYLFCCCTVMMGGGGGDAWEFVIAICIPFLLCFPSISYTTSSYDSLWSDGALPVAFILGTLAYSAVTVALYLYMVREFDQIAGRTVPCADSDSS